MSQNSNILRQIKDIQVQAERLIAQKGSLTDIDQFANYSSEIKQFLIAHIQDDFVLKHIHSIPDLNLNEISPKRTIMALLLNILGNGLGSYTAERQKQEEAYHIIRDIGGKYASAEFMLRNYFS